MRIYLRTRGCSFLCDNGPVSMRLWNKYINHFDRVQMFVEFWGKKNIGFCDEILPPGVDTKVHRLCKIFFNWTGAKCVSCLAMYSFKRCLSIHRSFYIQNTLILINDRLIDGFSWKMWEVFHNQSDTRSQIWFQGWLPANFNFLELNFSENSRLWRFSFWEMQTTFCHRLPSSWRHNSHENNLKRQLKLDSKDSIRRKTFRGVN